MLALKVSADFFLKEGRQATQKIWEEEMYDLITGRHFRQAEKEDSISRL